MTIVEHLYELRYRLLVALFAVFCTSILGFIWYTHGPFGLDSTGEILRGPYCDLPAQARAEITRNGECRLLATGVFDPFGLRLKVAIATGVVLACPVWLHQIWQFIVPGLHKNERRYTMGFVAAGAVLFVSGTVLAYFTITKAFNFFLTVGNEVQVTALQGSEYFSFVLNVMVIFGVSFELPLFVIALNIVGVLPYTRLKSWRRGLLMGMFVFSAVITPSGDPFSMLAMGVALAVLLELSIQFARIHDGRKARGASAAATDGFVGEVDDESASPEPSAPTPVGASADPATAGEPARPSPSPLPRGNFDDVL